MSATAVLIGAPGAGKTRTAKRVARALGIEHIDTDKRFVAEHGPIAEFFTTHGEPEFRRIERQLVAKQRLAILAKAVGELPPRCRDCFILRRFDDLDPDEIAIRMGISRNMVEKHLRQALIYCTARLREGD